jgi:hypothetical protein
MKALTKILSTFLIAISVVGCAARFTQQLGDAELNSILNQPPGSSGTNLTSQPLDPVAVEKSCTTYTIQRKTTPITFGRSVEGCAWGLNDNMDMHDQHFQARIEQTQTVDLPPGALICGIKLITNTTDFYYDDEFILDFKGMVLASSADFTNTFVSEGNYVRYDWGRIKARAWASVPMTPYCAGNDRGLGSCSWPDTSTNGPIVLYYDDQVIREMTALTSTDPVHQFRMTVTGDNDDAVDCRHNPVSFDVEVSYVQ